MTPKGEGEGDGMKSRLPFKTFSTLQIREKHLLDKAYVEYPDFPLVVTGHRCEIFVCFSPFVPSK